MSKNRNHNTPKVGVVGEGRTTVLPEEETPEVITEETVNTKEEEDKLPTFVAVISDKCSKLNIRTNPNANSDVITILDSGSEVIVDLNESTEDFYKVQVENSSIEGFAMKTFIKF